MLPAGFPCPKVCHLLISGGLFHSCDVSSRWIGNLEAEYGCHDVVELLQCASFYYLGYEGQVAYQSVICVSCALFLCFDEGFTIAVFLWLLKAPLSSDKLTIFVIDGMHVCSTSFISSVPI